MLRALEMLQTNPSIEFRSAVSRATGILDSESLINPDKVYTVTEISELFVYLFDLIQEEIKKRARRRQPDRLRYINKITYSYYKVKSGGLQACQ